MGLVILARPPLPHVASLAVPSSSRRASLPPPAGCRCRRLVPVRRLRSSWPVYRCSMMHSDVDLDHLKTEDEEPEVVPSISPVCSIPHVQSRTGILDCEPFNFLDEEQFISNLLLTELPVLSEEEQVALAATPAHLSGLHALYASSLAGNLVEQLWNFAWPAAVALLHPSLLPVAVVGFFTKLAIVAGGPLIGHFMDYFPRIPTYNFLSLIQTAAQLLSATMIIYAHTAVRHASASTVLLQPWFIVLVFAAGIERLAGLALGVTMERDWVVLLAGTNRPIALAEANAMLSRVDLLCEIAGPSIFGFLLAKYEPVTCLKLASGLMLCTFPLLILLGRLTNKLSSGALDRPKFAMTCDKPGTASLPSWRNLVKIGMNAIRNGWMEYRQQPVLPASVAYVLLYFNIALVPGALMTAFLTHQGISPHVIGGFSGLCALMGITATFTSASLVKRLGVLKAGAAGLIFQASLLATATFVFCSYSLSHRTPLLAFLFLIVLSRLGHMSYDVVGTQILQTGIPANKANLIGATEVSMSSLAELMMLGVAIIANDVSHFGFLAILSVSSVVGAAGMFCRWLANPSEEQKNLFSFDFRCHG